MRDRDQLQRFLKQGLKTIVFTKARRITELLYSWLRQQDARQAERVASYRSGFLPEERRRIERTCCYARQDKTWVQDPNGNSWEFFYVKADA